MLNTKFLRLITLVTICVLDVFMVMPVKVESSGLTEFCQNRRSSRPVFDAVPVVRIRGWFSDGRGEGQPSVYPRSRFWRRKLGNFLVGVGLVLRSCSVSSCRASF